jgi:hypothetical protein
LHCPSRPKRGSTLRAQGYCRTYRGRACDGYNTRLTGTVFGKTRQRPATPVLLLRGVAKGESTAHLARELGVSRIQLHTLRQRIPAHPHATAPTGVIPGPAFEADELSQNVGEKNKHPASRPHQSTALARPSAHRARHRCPRSASHHHQHPLARLGQAALAGL